MPPPSFAFQKTFRTSKNLHVFAEELTFVQKCIKGFERKVPVETKGRNSFQGKMLQLLLRPENRWRLKGRTEMKLSLNGREYK